MDNAGQLSGAPAGGQPGPQPQVPQPPAPLPATPPAPKKRMSTGAKWAIGLTVGFLVFMLGSCVLLFFALGGSDTTTFSYGDTIALIYIDDVISGTSGVMPEYILDQLTAATDDDSVKAIVLRVDSPGGTVAASQEIAVGVRKAAAIKPIVTSVGDMCASGAYMVASQSDEIVASPGSTVGSIGVIMDVVNAEELLDKVGLKFTTLTQGQYKDAGSPYRSLTATETAMLDAQMSVVYEQFIEDVAHGRGMTTDEVRELATGWAWLGSEALDLGLIDSLGNYDDAIDRAADLGGIEGDYTIEVYEETDPLTDLYLDLLGIFAPRDDIDADSLRRMSLPR